MLFGQRRIGKTSVLQHLEDRLPKEGPFLPVYFDLMAYGDAGLPDLLTGLAAAIALRLQRPRPDLGPDPKKAFRTWLHEALDALPQDHSLVLLLDEFDVMADPEADKKRKHAFFRYMRELRHTAAPNRLQFVFVLGRSMDDLDIVARGLFKDLPGKRVSLLAKKDAIRLIRLSEQEGSLRWTDAAVERVWALTHGHPYLTQALCAAVWDQAHDEHDEPPPVTPEQVDAAVPQTMERSRHMFEWIWSGLGPAEKVVAAALAQAGPRVVTPEDLEAILNESGVRIVIRELRDAPQVLQDWDILTPADGGYRFQVELLRRWLVETKPLSRVQAELDRIHPVADNLYQAARNLYLGGNLEGAYDLLTQALGFNPNHMAALELRGEIALSRGDLDAAQEDLERLHDLAPTRARARLKQLYLTRARLVEGEDENAEQTRLTWLEKALTMAPHDQEVQEEIAGLVRRHVRRLEAREQYEEARKYLQTWRERLPPVQWEDLLIRLERKTQLATWFRQGVQALEAGDREQAVEVLKQVVAEDPYYRRGAPIAALYQAVTGIRIAHPLLTPLTHEASESLGEITADTASRMVLLDVFGLGVVLDVTFSPDGRFLALGTSSGLWLYAPSDGTLRHLWAASPVWSVAFSPDGALLASGSVDKTVRLWRVEDGELVCTLEGHTDEVLSAAFSPDGALLASGSADKTVRLWWVRDGKLVDTLTSHTAEVWSVAFSPDGALLASASDDQTVQLWRVEDGELVRTLEVGIAVHSVAFSSDGAYLALGLEDGTVQLWGVKAHS